MLRSHLVSRRVLRTATTLTLALGAGLALPTALATTAGAAAPSATAAVNFNGRELSYTAAAGQANQVTVTESFTSDTDLTYVIDDAVPINAGNGCSYPDSADDTKVSCTVETVDSQSPYDSLVMDLADSDDVLSFHNKSDQAFYTNGIDLGTGDDELTDISGVDANAVWGGVGDDTITVGEAGLAFGGEGNDTLYGIGDGAIAAGGAGNDLLRGSAGDQNLQGDDGHDKLYGGDDGDHMQGGRGNDVMYGEGGPDFMWGNTGDDELYGGAGTDTLSGGAGRNIVVQD
ncbi:calcium-binding protein [Streptomyces sp. NPDC048825]|uniref:calcium-binding protein n=1 Tax=Streptomyces sp. NPDC048825 TaxID=3365592 RepID=UPI003711985D